jgi:hypothetical protein
MTTQKNEPVTRNRRIYANTLLDLMKILYGVGIDPSRVDFARMQETINGRVLFHPIIDNQPIFIEPHTIETLQAMFEAMKVYRGFVMRKGSVRGLMDLPPTFVNPSPLQSQAETLAQLGTVITESLGVSEHVKGRLQHLRVVPKDDIEPPQTVEAKPNDDAGKNPKRVEAGRRNAAKRWETNRDRRRR